MSTTRTSHRSPRLAIAVLLLGALVLASCGSSDATSPARYELVMNMTGMTPHVGQRLDLRVVHQRTMTEITRVRMNPIPGAAFEVAIPDILIAGETYWVDFYVDYNRNGRYDAPPADHAWRRVVNAPAATASLTFAHNANFTDVQFPDR